MKPKELPRTLDQIRHALRKTGAAKEEDIEAWTQWVLEQKRPTQASNTYAPNCEALRHYIITTRRAMEIQSPSSYLQGLYAGLTMAHDLISQEKWHRLEAAWMTEEQGQDDDLM